MNKQTQISQEQNRHSIKKALLVVAFALALGGNAGQNVAAGDLANGYDMNVLFNPSKTVLLSEAKGRVTIYDGLEHNVVDRALDTQFGRIENMMFVRTRETLPDGSVEVDDDC